MWSLILAVALLCGGIALVRAQGTDPKYDPIFAKVKTQEQTRKAHDVMAAYADITKEYAAANKDHNVAAEGLLRAAQFASSDRYGVEDEKEKRQEIHVEDPAQLPDAIKELREQMRADGDYKAHDAIKQLLEKYPQSPAAAYARETRFKETLEERIDKRNSARFSYKIVDALVALTGRIPAFSYWFALALIAFIVKLITFPLTLKMYRSQREMQRLQPILKEIQEKYKGKPELNEKVMGVYKEHGISPFASCLPMLIQLPFMYWVYETIRQYEFHFAHGTFLWIGSSLSYRFPNYLATNLAQFDMALLIIYALSNYLTMKLTPPSDPQAAQQQKTMSIMMTFMMLWMFMVYKWSAAFMFYWLVLNLISAYQQYIHIYKPNQSQSGSIDNKGGGGNRGSGGGTGGGGSKPPTSDEVGPKSGSSNGANGNGTQPAVSRPPTPVPGGDAMRARPRRKRR